MGPGAIPNCIPIRLVYLRDRLRLDENGFQFEIERAQHVEKFAVRQSASDGNV